MRTQVAYLWIPALRSKIVCIVRGLPRKLLSPHLCSFCCDNFGVKPSSLFCPFSWKLGAIGCRAVYPVLSFCKGHHLGLAVVIGTGMCPGPWLRKYKGRKLILLQCSTLKCKSSQFSNQCLSSLKTKEILLLHTILFASYLVIWGSN